MITEVEDKNKENAFEMAKKIKGPFLANKGNPLPALLPPGTVMAEANTTVAISTAANIHDVAVSFSHCSPSEIKSSCSSVNTIPGVFPSEFSFTL